MEAIFLKRGEYNFCMYKGRYSIVLNTYFNTISRQEALVKDLKLSDYKDTFNETITVEEFHSAYLQVINANTVELHNIGASIKNQFIENISKTDLEG